MFLLANGLATCSANEAHFNLNLRTEIQSIQREDIEAKNRDGGHREEEGER